jgi:hypothetical protein
MLPESGSIIWMILFALAVGAGIFTVCFFIKHIERKDMPKMIIFGALSLLCIYFTYAFAVASFYKCNHDHGCIRVCQMNADGETCQTMQNDNPTNCPPGTSWLMPASAVQVDGLLPAGGICPTAYR